VLVAALRFVAIVFAALVLGLAFCHVLEMPGKMALGGAEYMMVQRIYLTFGPVASVLEPGAIVASAALAFLVHRRRAPFAFTLAGAVLLAVALAVWFAVVNPVNLEWAALPPGTLGAGFEAQRARWEYGHAAHAALLFAGFVALVASVLVEVPSSRTLSDRRDTWRRVA
jgi:hypothetical protein